jgi:outer membrane protein TolC
MSLAGGVQQASYLTASQEGDGPATKKAGPPVPAKDDAAGMEAELPRLGPPVIPPPAQERALGFADVLAWAGVDNPTIALAEEAVRASEALRIQARAMLFPTLNAGSNARFHQGNLQGSAGIIRDVNIQSVYFGGGAGAVTAGTVEVPGIRLVAHLGDAYYAPQAVEQQVVGRRFEAIAVRHQTLLDVSTRYLALVAAHARLESLRRSEEDRSEVVRVTANFAKTGQGRESDAQRARAGWLLLESQIQKAQEDVAVAAAELARLLDRDPSEQLQPTDAAVPLIELVDPAMPLTALLQTALANHPELGARAADVAGAQIRVRQERVRPWLPLIAAGASLGNFGGAGSQSTTAWASGMRIDFDVVAVWSLQNLGLGNRALQNRTQAQVGEADAERLRVANRIREEVGESFALVLARRNEIDIARRRIDSASKAFAADMLRANNLEGRPIEVLRSLDLLTAARLDLVRAMADYSEAQLRLYVAIGNSPAQR